MRRNALRYPVEEVVVTGSSIRGVASAGSPVIALDHEAFVQSGLATSSDLARALPQVINLGADESRLGGAQDGAANTTRVSGINLRGIGNEATLLLINGRRLAPAGVIKSSTIRTSSPPPRSSAWKSSSTARRPSTARMRSRAW